MEWWKDCKVELIYVATGTTQRPGGQHAGSPATSVRVTHIPTGIMAQGEMGYHSQHKAKKIAFEMVEWGLMEFGYPLGEVK